MSTLLRVCVESSANVDSVFEYIQLTQKQTGVWLVRQDVVVHSCSAYPSYEERGCLSRLYNTEGGRLRYDEPSAPGFYSGCETFHFYQFCKG